MMPKEAQSGSTLPHVAVPWNCRNACEFAKNTTRQAEERQRIKGPTSALSVHRSLARTNSARNAFVACTVNIAFPAAL